MCSDGSEVYAPFDVTLHGKVIVYTDPAKSAINNGINLRGEGGSNMTTSPMPAMALLIMSLTRSCRSVLQAVLREPGPDLWHREEGGEARHHAAHADGLSRHHVTHPRPDV